MTYFWLDFMFDVLNQYYKRVLKFFQIDIKALEY